jgi:hypothetical protein
MLRVHVNMIPHILIFSPNQILTQVNARARVFMPKTVIAIYDVLIEKLHLFEAGAVRDQVFL